MKKIVGLIYLVALFQEGCLSPTPPISPDGCIIDGVHFRPGEEISRGTEGPWCFGFICSENGQVITWDGLNCNTETSTSPNIRQPSTKQQQTGCYTGERWIQPGEITFEGRSESFCYGFYCNTDGTLSSWEDWNCSP